MSFRGRSVLVIPAGLALCGASAVYAVDLPDPVYTYCEIDNGDMIATDRLPVSLHGNDTFGYIETVSAPSEFADCFYITGKLQEDCIWARQPKCCIVAYSKPIQAFDSDGRDIGLVEEVIAVADPFEGMAHFQIPLLEDGTVRLGVSSVFDCFDGTLNGLFSNGIHGEVGQVLIAGIFSEKGLPGERLDIHDFEYKYRFGGPYSEVKRGPSPFTGNAGDALRLAYIGDEGDNVVDVWCIDDTGTKEICWDVDFYSVEGLEPRELYCITQVGGKNYECEATDTVLGWFDKNGNLQGGELGINDGEGSSNVIEYAEICVIADDLGIIRFAISGVGDSNFNGLRDAAEENYLMFLEDEGYILDDNNVVKGENWVPGASVKTNPDDVVRLSREDFDDSGYAYPPAHNECGCYTLKVRLNPHEDEGDDDDDFGGGGLAQRADMSGDGFVDAVDLAMLLSFWGPVQ